MDTNITRNQAIGVIESLRAGIPTRTSTRYLPEVRSALIERFNQDLARFNTDGSILSGRLIWGAYGQGKTHELTCIEHLALDEGFAVSRITLNRQLSGQNLFKLYQKLATSIRTTSSQRFGIQHDLETKRASDLPSLSQPHDRYTHPLPAIVLENYLDATGQDKELLYANLLGAKLPISDIRRIHRQNLGRNFPILETFSVNKHGKAYFELMADVITGCGYKGWVILIDEVELVARLGKAGRLQAYTNLSYLLNWPQQFQFPIYTVGAVAIPLSDLWCNPHGTRLPDQETMPEMAAIKFNQAIEQQIRLFFQKALDHQISPEIVQLEQEQLVKLLERITEIHGISYDWQPNIKVQEIITSIGNNPVRTHIRAVLESLDISYQYSEKIDLKLDKLVTEDTSPVSEDE